MARKLEKALMLLAFTSTLAMASPTPPHHCESDARMRASRLLDFHVNAGEDKESRQPVKIYPDFEVPKPIRNPVNPAQKLDVLEFTGYVDGGKGVFRIRLIYIHVPNDCVMVGEEILNWGSF